MTQPRPSLFARLATPDPAPPWSLAAAFFAAVAALLLIIAAYIVLATWLGDSAIVRLAGWTLGTGLLAVYVLRWRDKDRAALQLAASNATLPLLLVLNIGAAMLIDLIGLGVTGQFLPVPELVALASDPSSIAAWVFAAAFMLITQPVGEELAFRGMTQPALRAALGGWLGLVITAVIYGIAHWLAYPPAYAGAAESASLWYALVVPILHGVLFGINRAATGSTRAAIWAHAAVGLFELLKVLAITQ